MQDTLTHLFIGASLLGYVVGAVQLARIRRRTRASLLVDSLLRTILPLLVVELILVGIETTAPDHVHSWGWTAITAILAGLAAYLLWPVYVLTRMGGSNDGYVLFSRALLAGLHTKLEDLYGASASRVISYGIGKTAGEKDARSAMATSRVPPERWWGVMPYIFRATGLGRLKVQHMDLGKELRLSVDDCFEAYHGHEGGVPGCDLTRGYFAGLGKALYPDRECQAEETRCASVDGGHRCEFTIRWFEPVPMPAPTPAPVATGA